MASSRTHRTTPVESIRPRARSQFRCDARYRSTPLSTVNQAGPVSPPLDLDLIACERSATPASEFRIPTPIPGSCIAGSGPKFLPGTAAQEPTRTMDLPMHPSYNPPYLVNYRHFMSRHVMSYMRQRYAKPYHAIRDSYGHRRPGYLVRCSILTVGYPRPH